ncbi:MAG: hypothetical protein IT449_04585 [Phycisphaerales bacterium]|nr:hypothetical protein [Phycisphaerales bacterium]
MGKIQKQLQACLRAAGLGEGRGVSKKLGQAAIQIEAELKAEVHRVYRKLGGLLEAFPTRRGKWDLECDGFVIELDEAQHFNRSRRTTLDSAIYQALPLFPLNLWREYCADRERDCLSKAGYGGWWTNSSCERQFGPAGEKGDLDSGGSPRWKQRAFYDFLKDLHPLICGFEVVRISIYDIVAGSTGHRTVGQVLKVRDPSRDDGGALKRLIESRRSV